MKVHNTTISSCHHVVMLHVGCFPVPIGLESMSQLHLSHQQPSHEVSTTHSNWHRSSELGALPPSSPIRLFGYQHVCQIVYNHGELQSSISPPKKKKVSSSNQVTVIYLSGHPPNINETTTPSYPLQGSSPAAA